MPTCLRCRRETDAPAPRPEPRRETGDVVVDLDPALLAAAARELAPEASRTERAGLRALGFCPSCGQPL